MAEMTIFLSILLKDKAQRHALVLVSCAVLLVVVGGVVFGVTQGLPITTGWYWAITTATTVGYGDITPHNPAGRVVASVFMLTTIPLLASAFALFTGSAVASGVRRILQMASAFPEGSYRLILGMQPSVPTVLQELELAGTPVVLVADVDPDTVPGHVHLIRGDPTVEATLRKGRPAGATHILVACETDGDVLMASVLLQEEAPGVPITALVSSRRLLGPLRDLGVGQILSPAELTGHTLAKALEAPHAGDLLVHLILGEHHQLVEHVVDKSAAPRRLSDIRKSRSELILGVVHAGVVSLGIGADDPEITTGDVLLMVEPNGSQDPRHQDKQAGAAAG
jgi:voltage-gated potassium channel